MKNKVFYIVMSIVLVLCILGACVTTPDDGTSDMSSAASRPAESSAGSESLAQSEAPAESGEPSENSSAPSEESSTPPAESSAPSDESSDTSSDVSQQPVIPPDPSEYSDVTDANLGSDAIDSYFNDSVFVGNSIMLHYKNYVTRRRGSDSGFLGNAKFHASASFSCANTMQPITDSSTHPLYQGEKMKIEDAVAAMGAKTVYFSGMALNEVGIFGAEESARNLATVVDAIKAKSPDVKIVILANTYMVKNFNSYQKLHNGSISEYNNLLLDYCNENGYDFVDITTPLVASGCLADKFCTDNAEGGSGCHLTNDAYAIWTAVLRDYAKAEQAGTYVNPDSMPVYSRN